MGKYIDRSFLFIILNFIFSLLLVILAESIYFVLLFSSFVGIKNFIVLVIDILLWLIIFNGILKSNLMFKVGLIVGTVIISMTFPYFIVIIAEFLKLTSV